MGDSIDQLGTKSDANTSRHVPSAIPLQNSSTAYFIDEDDWTKDWTKIDTESAATLSTNVDTKLSYSPPGSPLQLHRHDSYEPLSLPPSVLGKEMTGKGTTADDDTRKVLRMLLERQAECCYQETKLSFWRDIACLVTTKPSAANEFLIVCVKGCGGDGGAGILGSMAKLLRAGTGDYDLQYCVLASLFHAMQTNQYQRENLSLLHPDVLGPLADLVRRAAEFTASHYDTHLRVYALGLVSWFACKQAVASVSCGATLPIEMSECVVNAVIQNTRARANTV